MRTERLYRIRPLVWEAVNEFFEEAKTPHGLLTACHGQDGYWWRLVGVSAGGDRFKTLEAAKQAAEAHWRERVAECLEAVEL